MSMGPFDRPVGDISPQEWRLFIACTVGPCRVQAAQTQNFTITGTPVLIADAKSSGLFVLVTEETAGAGGQMIVGQSQNLQPGFSAQINLDTLGGVGGARFAVMESEQLWIRSDGAGPDVIIVSTVRV